MDLNRYFSIRQLQHHHQTRSSTSHSHSFQHPHKSTHRKHLPLLASPINKDALRTLPLSSSSTTELENLSTAATSDTAAALATTAETSYGNSVIYKQHHEASTIELFYDLFFVANLAYFTAVHQHTNAAALVNYLKLFTLMWFTWLSVTLFDVRFSVDCVWNRLCKAIHFGCWAGFTFAGPLFDQYDKVDDVKSYRYFAIVIAVSRFTIALQYFVVMAQGRKFRQTLLPVGLSGAIHLISAIAFMVTYSVFPDGRVGTSELVAWFVFSIVEGFLIFAIAIAWRVVSFKYTHLVERCQLLTLIIIGEGIIGMVKSVACITKGQAKNNSSELGTVVAAVLLLYLMWMLYFDQMSHDRFGTVRQQIWSLLHYPLHTAILLCVEGNTSLIVWNSAVQGLKYIWAVQPHNYADPAAGFDSTDAYIGYLNKTMYDIEKRFKEMSWNKTYYWPTNITTINNYTFEYEFRTKEWNNKTGDITELIFTNAQVFTFQAHKDTLAKLSAVTSPSTSVAKTLEAIFDVFNVTVLQFYIGAGAMLLLLAIMYWFNKLHKTKYEFGEMISRTIFGFGIIIIGVLAVLANKTTSGFKFQGSHWIIPIVVICFLLVLLFDNVLLSISHRTWRRPGHSRASSWNGTTANEDTDTQGLISKYPSSGSHSATFPQSPFTDTTSYSPSSCPLAAQSQSRDFAIGEGRERASTGSENTETRAKSVGFAVTPPTPQSPNDDVDGHGGGGRLGGRTGSGYDSLGLNAEEYEGDGYEEHPLSMGVREGV